jgi:hypothetical protein
MNRSKNIGNKNIILNKPKATQVTRPIANITTRNTTLYELNISKLHEYILFFSLFFSISRFTIQLVQVSWELPCVSRISLLSPINFVLLLYMTSILCASPLHYSRFVFVLHFRRPPKFPGHWWKDRQILPMRHHSPQHCHPHPRRHQCLFRSAPRW